MGYKFERLRNFFDEYVTGFLKELSRRLEASFRVEHHSRLPSI